jgi:hypothetical protein
LISVSLEFVENPTVLAALTLIDISGALIGATYITLALDSERFITKIPLVINRQMVDNSYWLFYVRAVV